MRDHIDRQKVIDKAVEFELFGEKVKFVAVSEIEKIPSAEDESFEWCTDRKEYDQEAHCCHRYSKVIRNTVEEMKLVHCHECQYSEYDSIYGDRYCHYNGKAEVVDDYHYCRDGERRENA